MSLSNLTHTGWAPHFQQVDGSGWLLFLFPLCSLCVEVQARGTEMLGFAHTSPLKIETKTQSKGFDIQRKE